MPFPKHLKQHNIGDQIIEQLQERGFNYDKARRLVYTIESRMGIVVRRDEGDVMRYWKALGESITEVIKQHS